MKKKVSGIFVIMLLISTIAIPTVAIKNIETQKNFRYTSHQSVDFRTDIIYQNPQIITSTNNRIPKILVAFHADIIEMIEQVDESMILSYLENITSFGPRLTATQSCEDAGNYLFNEFLNMDLDVRYQNWSYMPTYYGSNIEATLPGSNPESDYIFIVCAHYDSTYNSPGADDDASGIAVILAAANIMSQYTFNHTVRFVAFSGEEQGTCGSYYYAKEAANNGDRIIGTLNADAISYAPNEENASKIKILENEDSVWITNYTDEIAHTYYDYINLDVIPWGFSGQSDHYRFWQFGYNAIWYLEHEISPYHHSENDTIEKYNLTYSTRVTRLILATLADLAQSFKGFPVFEISEITGGMGVSAVITNVGTAAATNVNWSITLDGRFIFIGGEKKDIISTLAVDDSITVDSKPIVGFGRAEIIVSTENKEVTATCFVIPFFVFGIQEGR